MSLACSRQVVSGDEVPNDSVTQEFTFTNGFYITLTLMVAWLKYHGLRSRGNNGENAHFVVSND